MNTSRDDSQRTLNGLLDKNRGDWKRTLNRSSHFWRTPFLSQLESSSILGLGFSGLQARIWSSRSVRLIYLMLRQRRSMADMKRFTDDKSAKGVCFPMDLKEQLKDTYLPIQSSADARLLIINSAWNKPSSAANLKSCAISYPSPYTDYGFEYISS